MNIEEKAKRYDEALKVIKDNLDALNEIAETGAKIVNIQTIKNCFHRAFPELKESEDERIRKAIIEHFAGSHSSMYPYKGFTKKQIIAWLEKQDEQKSIWHNEDEEPQKDSLILLIMQSGNPIVAKIIEPNHSFNHGEKWAYIEDLLEVTKEEKVDNQNCVKSTDKVEPKFKVGDWITDGNITIQIEAIKNDCYLYCGDCVLYSTKTADKVYHLWTIQDAKPGDIITWKGSMFMFRGIGNKERSDVVDYYCDLIHDILGDEFKIQFGGHHWGFLPSSLYDYEPANKEERELFFHKMNEAGYEWDSEKLKLKKISKR